MSSRPLRVLHLGKYYTPHRGGIETYLETLCVAMRDKLDVQVMVANDGRANCESLVASVPVFRAGTFLTVASAPLCPGMVHRIREIDADLIHMHLPNPGVMLAYLASGYRGPLVITYHSDIVRQRLMGKVLQPVIHRVLSQAAAVIVNSEKYLNTSPVLTAHRNRCRVIPFGISTEPYESLQRRAVADIRSRYGPKIILAVGRLVYYKGFDQMIRGMAKIDGRLLIVGTGPLDRTLRKLAADIGVADRVHFLGEIENLIPYYQAADVFVLPSTARSEAFGLVQLEAMACGKPVVNTELDSAVPFVSQHGLTGLTVPPGNPDVLAQAVSLLLEDANLRLHYGAAAKQRVQSEFSLERMVQRTSDLYMEVMRGARPFGRSLTSGNLHVVNRRPKAVSADRA